MGFVHHHLIKCVTDKICFNSRLVSSCPVYRSVCMHGCDGVLTPCLQLQREILSYHTEQATKAVCKGFRDLRRVGRRERHGVRGCEVGGHEGRKGVGIRWK